MLGSKNFYFGFVYYISKYNWCCTCNCLSKVRRLISNQLLSAEVFSLKNDFNNSIYNLK